MTSAIGRSAGGYPDFSVLRDTGYGVGFHWTTRTYPHEGRLKLFQKAVENFDVRRFVDQVLETGAGHVLFTGAHIGNHFAAPHPVIDDILPGRTCERDLLMDIAQELAKHGIKFILYYNSATYDHDERWRTAVGACRPDPTEFFENYENILRWIGEHYGELITAYWIDGGYKLAALKPTPWKQLYDATKAGNPRRLVSWASGVQRHLFFTEHQDYWSGEVTDLRFRPRGDCTPFGLPWYAFASYHIMQNPDVHVAGGLWGIFSPEIRELKWKAPPVQTVVDFIRGFQAVGGTVTLNLLCYQEGDIHPSDRRTMAAVRKSLGR